MSDIAIRVENLSKMYRIGVRDEQPRGLGRAVRSLAGSPFAYLQRSRRPPTEEETLWALRDVSFDVKQGEVIGIIGRNGAGKSTLLKILSRITEPSGGEAHVFGRVGSLLEVGTGFHPELTGRENIYLNGTIMGMKRAEIERKLDEIVDFSGVEKFLDTPVKRYSSGMYVRLAFAVAAHLEPEILLVDEVLAVGDAEFQKKCLGKMGEVAREGRTILFVSHNMASILSLCQTAALLDSGRIIRLDTVENVVQSYYNSVISADIRPLEERQDRSGDGSARITRLCVEAMDADKVIRSNSRLRIAISYRSAVPIRHARFLVGIYDYTNTGIFALDSDAVGGLTDTLESEGNITCITDPINLTPGRCYANLALFRNGVMADYVQWAGSFDVETTDFYGTGKMPTRDWVLCVLQQKWFVTGVLETK